MRFIPAVLLAAFVCCSITSCGVNVISHDEHAAARTAEEFATLAYVKSDYTKAEVLLSPQAQKAVPRDKMAAVVGQMHPTGGPSSVKAIEFEPMHGQRAMNVFLKGTRGTEDFYYRCVMVGDKGSGYKVGGFARGTGPYPPSARRPL